MKKKNSFLPFVYIVIFVIISAIYLYLRLNNISNLLFFRQDQAIHLTEAKSMVDTGKITLLGPTSSKNFMGRSFFFGPDYTYILAILGILLNWNPLSITITFILIDFVITIIFFTWLKNKVGIIFSLLFFGLISFSPYLVINSRFYWNPHLLFPLSMLLLIFIEKYQNSQKIVYLIVSSFIWGVAFSCHFTAITWLFIFVYYLIKNKKIVDFKLHLIIFLFFILGNLPYFIFEIRHSFYNIKTLLFVFSNSIESNDLNIHYIAYPWLVPGIYFLIKLFVGARSKIPTYLILAFFITLIFIQYKYFNGYSTVDNIRGWNYPEQLRAAKLLTKKGCLNNYNIAGTMQGDTRLSDLRFLLNIEGCPAFPVNTYPSNDVLYVFSPKNRNPENDYVWEITSFKPFKIIFKETFNNYLDLYLIERSK